MSIFRTENPCNSDDPPKYRHRKTKVLHATMQLMVATLCDWECVLIIAFQGDKYYADYYCFQIERKTLQGTVLRTSVGCNQLWKTLGIISRLHKIINWQVEVYTANELLTIKWKKLKYFWEVKFQLP